MSGNEGMRLRGGVDSVEVEGKEDDQMGKYRECSDSEFETISRVSDVTQPLAVGIAY